MSSSSINNKDFISKRLQLIILGCIIIQSIINFFLLVIAQNNYNYISHTYNQSRSNFDFMSYLNDTIHELCSNPCIFNTHENTDKNLSEIIDNDTHIIKK